MERFRHERIDISFSESSFRGGGGGVGPGGGGGEVRPLIRVQSVIVRMKRIQFCLERIDISYGESFFSQCSASHLSQGHIKKLLT